MKPKHQLIKPKHQRLIFVLAALFFGLASLLLVMSALEQKVVFFFSPSEVTEAMKTPGKVIRIGGLVEEGSVHPLENAGGIEFTVTDLTQRMSVRYAGMLPTLFREGQGVVAEGSFSPDGIFTATQVLAKHDENYMPPEVAKSLKRSGRWKGGQP